MVADTPTANRRARANSSIRSKQRIKRPQTYLREPQPNVVSEELVNIPAPILKSSLKSSTQLSTSKINLDNQTERLKLRSKRLTICLLCLVGAISSLTPLTVSTHATQRVGLMLLETDLIQFRASLVALVITSSLLLSLFIGQKLLGKFTKSNPLLSSAGTQRVCKFLICISAATSAISYLSISLIVPHVKQIQRMPLATFDCNANQIAIENCLQRFSAKDGKQTVLDAIQLLLVGGLDGNSERLIRKLNCFNFNNEQLDRLKVPTRFLLHKCGLVCKPQRQQLYQFNDDLNRDQSTTDYFRTLPNSNDEPRHKTSTSLHAPYTEEAISAEESHLLSMGDQLSSAELGEHSSGQVSLKVCFWGEFSGGSSYKQFCITNLASENRNETSQDPARRGGHSLSVGQMNALLKRYTFSEDIDAEQQPREEDINTVSASTLGKSDRLRPSETISDQSTSYVNPIVQFESQFKDWPLLQRSQSSDLAMSGFRANSDNWCHFRPIPPFIVNNKPFSDIQCSIEHEYTITTRSSRQVSSDQIYLKKQHQSNSNSVEGSSYLRERCSIQCKVNLLYRVHVNGDSERGQSDRSERLKDRFGHEPNIANFYLPLKPCSFVVGNGNKFKTASYYLNLRIVGDTSLILAVILLNILLLIESIDTKKFSFEARKLRLFGVIFALAFMPPLASSLLELSGYLLPKNNQESERDGYLITLINERLLPSVSEWFQDLVLPARIQTRYSQTIMNNPNLANGSQVNNSSSTMQDQHAPSVGKKIDYFVVPFFLYALFMCMLSVMAARLPVATKSETTFVRIASTEMLNMKRHKQDKSRIDDSTGSDNSSSYEADSTRKINAQNQAKVKRVSLDFRVGIFVAIIWFMGMQFWLSQLCQIQIMIDIFGPMNGLAIAISPAPVAAVFAMLVAILFRDEISTFLCEFSPFAIDLDQLSRKVEFNKFLSVATLTYALRYFILANLNATSSFSWPLVMLFQIGEILNFPLIWFTISKRAYEVTVLDKKPTLSPNKRFRIDPDKSSKSILNNLLMMQLTLAVIYFVLGRSSAIFLHTIGVSLHLHDDNIDWFIKSFYGEQLVAATKNRAHAPRAGNHTRDSVRSDNIVNQMQPLFSPLPDEYQTYLHASRLFIKYNSLICLLFGLMIFGNFLYDRYMLYRLQEKRRIALEKEKLAKLNRHENLTDRQLVLDLKRLHSDLDKETNYSDSVDSSGTDHQARQSRGKRARFLFHYDTKIPQADSSSSDIELPQFAVHAREDQTRLQPSQVQVEEMSEPKQEYQQKEEKDQEKGPIEDAPPPDINIAIERNMAAPLATDELDEVDLKTPVADEDYQREFRKEFMRNRERRKDIGLSEKYSRAVSKKVRIVETRDNK